MEENTPQPSIKRKIGKKTLIIGAVVILVIAAGAGIYFFMQASADPEAAARREAEAVVRQVSRHMVLPEGETPTLATVSDPEKLKDQKFFANAKKGDKVLIYSTAQKAILYDPEADRIIEVAPINIGGTQ